VLNVALLRKVQDSIADESIPFNMGSWYHCIAGHTCKVVGTRSYQADMEGEAASLLGLEADLPDACFSLFKGDSKMTRMDAIMRIEQYILTHEAVEEIVVRRAQEYTKLQEQVTEEVLAVA